MKRVPILSLVLLAVMLSATTIYGQQSPQPEKKITIDLHDAPIRQALQQLFEGSGLSYALSDSVPNNSVELHLRDVRLEEALRTILRATGLTYRKEGEMYLIDVKRTESTPTPSTRPWAKPVKVHFKDVPLDQALDMLLKDTGVSYTYSSTIGDRPSARKVTAVFDNVPLETALSQTLKAAGLSFRKEDTVLAIVDPQPTYGGYNPYQDPAAAAINGQSRRVESILVKYIDPQAMVHLGPGSGVEVIRSSDKAVVVRGTDDAIRNFRELVKMIDIPTSVLRAVRVTADVSITLAGADGKSSTYRASTSSVGVEGSVIPLEITGNTPGTGRGPNAPPAASAAARWLELRLYVTPTLTSADASANKQTIISFTGKGSVQGRLPLEFDKSFEVAVAVNPSQQNNVTVAAGEVQLDTGSVKFNVSITADIEKNAVQAPVAQPSMPGGYGSR